MAMLFITHDLDIVRKIADRVCVMQRGEIVESGATERVLRSAAAPVHAPPARRRAEGRAGAGAAPARRRSSRCHDLKVWYPIKAGLLRRTVDYVRAVDGISLDVRAGRDASASSARAAPARPRSAWRCCG